MLKCNITAFRMTGHVFKGVGANSQRFLAGTANDIIS